MLKLAFVLKTRRCFSTSFFCLWFNLSEIYDFSPIEILTSLLFIVQGTTFYFMEYLIYYFGENMLKQFDREGSNCQFLSKLCDSQRTLESKNFKDFMAATKRFSLGIWSENFKIKFYDVHEKALMLYTRQNFSIGNDRRVV